MGILRYLGRALSSFSGFLRNNWLSIVAAAALVTVIALAIFPPTWVLIAATVLSFGFIATTGAAAAGPLALATVSAIMGACVYAAGSILGLIGRAGHWAFSSLFSARAGSAHTSEGAETSTNHATSDSAVTIQGGLSTSTAGSSDTALPPGAATAAAAAATAEGGQRTSAPTSEGSLHATSGANIGATAAGSQAKPHHARGLSFAALLQRFGISRSTDKEVPASSLHSQARTHSSGRA